MPLSLSLVCNPSSLLAVWANESAFVKPQGMCGIVVDEVGSCSGCAITEFFFVCVCAGPPLDSHHDYRQVKLDVDRSVRRFPSCKDMTEVGHQL